VGSNERLDVFLVQYQFSARVSAVAGRTGVTNLDWDRAFPASRYCPAERTTSNMETIGALVAGNLTFSVVIMVFCKAGIGARPAQDAGLPRLATHSPFATSNNSSR
jgi:hypothetical protein